MHAVLAADPFLNDANFVLSVLTLEELGATGNKVCFCQKALPCIALQSLHIYVIIMCIHAMYIIVYICIHCSK